MTAPLSDAEALALYEREIDYLGGQGADTRRAIADAVRAVRAASTVEAAAMLIVRWHGDEARARDQARRLRVEAGTGDVAGLVEEARRLDAELPALTVEILDAESGAAQIPALLTVAASDGDYIHVDAARRLARARALLPALARALTARPSPPAADIDELLRWARAIVEANLDPDVPGGGVNHGDCGNLNGRPTCWVHVMEALIAVLSAPSPAPPSAEVREAAAEVLRLDAEATPGPWTAMRHGGEVECEVSGARCQVALATAQAATRDERDTAPAIQAANAAFIARVRTLAVVLARALAGKGNDR